MLEQGLKPETEAHVLQRLSLPDESINAFTLASLADESQEFSDLSIMVRHVLPNAMTAALTFLPFILSGAVTTLTALDFLGFGLPAGSPSLGALLAQGKTNLHAPWLGLTGFVTVGVMLTLLIFVGEGVRDAFDPRRTMVASGTNP